MGHHADPTRPRPADRARASTRENARERRRISMQRKLGRRAITVGLTALALAVAGAPGDAHAQKKGGVLKIGNLGEPPSLDPHWGTPDHHRGAVEPHLRGPL